MLDVFFQEEYGKLYEKPVNGVCEVFEFSSENGKARSMYIKRPVSWLIDGIQYYDAITPYGYGGPLAVDCETTSELVNQYYDAWRQYCLENRIVCEFIRFHLFDNIPFREGFPSGAIKVCDDVVRILDIDMESMWMEFEHKVRKNVKKAQSNGLTVITDATGEKLSEFLEIYTSTMDRNDAKSFYYFDRTYFEQIISTLEGRFMFFHVLHEDTVVSTELVIYSDRYVYSFLGGTLEQYYPMRPNDLLKYEIIKWCKDTNHLAFILGGGYGGNDGIYKYKKAFAPGADVPFYIGKQVFIPEVYQRLVDIRASKVAFDGESQYFPLYRS